MLTCCGIALLTGPRPLKRYKEVERRTQSPEDFEALNKTTTAGMTRVVMVMRLFWCIRIDLAINAIWYVYETGSVFEIFP